MLRGGAGNDTITGGTADDTLYDGTGNDSMSGDDGADIFVIQDGFGTDLIYGGDGGPDNDTIDLNALSTGVTLTFNGDEEGTITDGTNTASSYGIERFVLSDQNDVVTEPNPTSDPMTVEAAGETTLSRAPMIEISSMGEPATITSISKAEPTPSMAEQRMTTFSPTVVTTRSTAAPAKTRSTSNWARTLPMANGQRPDRDRR
ncbi:MAG: hypothetical protein AAF479_15935 [Pseudomonadota bacterium]